MNGYVIDTHILLWLLFEPNKIHQTIMTILQDPRHDVFVCSSSFWEIAIKFRLGKLELYGLLPGDLPNAIQQMSIMPLQINHNTMATLFQLPDVPKHKDPFDRLMIHKCIQDGYCLVSQDSKFDVYRSFGLLLLDY